MHCKCNVLKSSETFFGEWVIYSWQARGGGQGGGQGGVRAWRPQIGAVLGFISLGPGQGSKFKVSGERYGAG